MLKKVVASLILRFEGIKVESFEDGASMSVIFDEINNFF
jgi:hypothetical protein